MALIDSQHEGLDGSILAALADDRSSTRMQAALSAGSRPDPRFVDALLERCGVEPDFFVRDMLTWALTRHPASITVPKLLEEIRTGRPQACSQALHTLSKIGDRTAWPAITSTLLRNPDDEIARSAWRAAVVLVPEEERASLGAELATQLGRGDREMQLSLSRAMIALGDLASPLLEAAMSSGDPRVRAHAIATERLLRDPDAGFALAIDEAKRIDALGPGQAEGSS